MWNVSLTFDRKEIYKSWWRNAITAPKNRWLGSVKYVKSNMIKGLLVRYSKLIRMGIGNEEYFDKPNILKGLSSTFVTSLTLMCFAFFITTMSLSRLSWCFVITRTNIFCLNTILSRGMVVWSLLKFYEEKSIWLIFVIFLIFLS